MDNGWISLHRKIRDNPIWKNSQLVHIFVELLLLANHEQTKFLWNGKEETLKRGQLITGRLALAQNTGIPTSSIRNYLSLLQKLGILDIKPNNKFSLITIIKYSDYQDRRQKVDSTLDNKRTTRGQQEDTYNKDNKDNNEIKNRKTSFSNLESFLNSPQKHIRIIGSFCQVKGLQFSTPEEWTVFAKRWMKTAADIAKFEDNKINSALNEAMKWDKWTLNTVYLKLTGQNL